MSCAPSSTPWPWPCRLSQRPNYPLPAQRLPAHLRFPPRPVVIIIDFSPLSSLSRRYRYYAALNRDIYEHLSGYSEQAMWQVSKHLHPNNLDGTRVDDLPQAISNRMMEQWQVVVATANIQLNYEDDQGYDIILQPDHSIMRVLSTCRPDWPRRQYDAWSSAPAWRDVVIIADFSTLSSLADENWNFSAMHPSNHVPLTTMEEKALSQYTRLVYANQVDTFAFDTVLSGIVERIEEQWQISLRTDDLEVRYDENNGLEVFQVIRDQPFWNLRHLLDQYRPEWQIHQFSSFCLTSHVLLRLVFLSFFLSFFFLSSFLFLLCLFLLDVCHLHALLVTVSYRFKMSGIKRDATMAHLTWPIDSRPPTSESASSQAVLPLPPPPHVGDSISLSGTTMDYDTTYGAADIVPAAPFIPDTTDDDRARVPVNPAGMKRIPKHQLTFTVCEWHGGTQSDLQVAELNLETNSFREHQVEFFFYKLVGDWHTAQKMGNYWRQHYGPETLPVDPAPAPEVRDPTAGVLPDVSTLDPATVYAAQLMTVCRSLPPAASPEQHRNQLLRLVQDSGVRNLFTPIDLNTLANQIH
eukprot:s995_g2.t1